MYIHICACVSVFVYSCVLCVDPLEDDGAQRLNRDEQLGLAEEEGLMAWGPSTVRQG